MKKIAPDKWRHFYAGILMGVVLQLVSLYFLYDSWLYGAVYVFIFIVVISYGFELFSKITGLGYYEINDALASILGGVVGAGLVIALAYLS